jgi:hypothetical protein
MADAGTKPQGSALNIDAGVNALLGTGSREANPEQEEEASEQPEAEEAEAAEAEDTEQAEDEAEADADDADDSEAEPEEDDDTEDEDEYETILVDGEEVQVTRDELKKGYQRQADYTRKTQEVAEQRKQVEQERQQYQQTLQQLSERARQYEQALEQSFEQEPDWNRLWQEDPDEYNRQRWEWQDRKERLQQAQRERQEAERHQQAERQRQFQARVQEEHQKLVNDRLPQWQDPDTAKREKQDVMTYAKQLGYTDDELQYIADSRAVEALYKAMKYDDLQSKKPAAKKKAAKAPKPARSGTPKTKRDVRAREQEQLNKRLSKTGSVNDAVDLLMTRNRKR